MTLLTVILAAIGGWILLILFIILILAIIGYLR